MKKDAMLLIIIPLICLLGLCAIFGLGYIIFVWIPFLLSDTSWVVPFFDKWLPWLFLGMIFFAFGSSVLVYFETRNQKVK